MTLRRLLCCLLALPRVRRSVPALATTAFVILALLAPSALALGVIEEYAPLEYSYLSPPVGTNFVKEEPTSTWVMVAAHGLGAVSVNIATSPLTGTDEHTLSDLDRVCCGPTLNESHTNEGVYTGSSNIPIFLEAGTYYWQMEAGVFSCPPPEYQCHSVKYQTPIYTFVVTPKPAPPPAPPPPAPQPAPSPPTVSAPPITLALAESYSDVKDIIIARSGHNAHHLKAKCRNTSQSQAKCIASWFTALHVSPSTSVYSGDFYIDKRGEGDFFTFVGIKAKVGCTERHSLKHCESKVHWQTVT